MLADATKPANAPASPPDRWALLWGLMAVGAVAALYVLLKPEGRKRRSDSGWHYARRDK